MGLIIRKYENEIDKCFYESSNVIYSECIDKKDAYKDLIVVFKDGRAYKYKDVIIQDYLLFRQNESQGKALNKYILTKFMGKDKYKFEKLDKFDISLLEKEKQLLIEEVNDESLKILKNDKNE
jgi:tRNA(His) 5'-end guanylyltransferase